MCQNGHIISGKTKRSNPQRYNKSMQTAENLTDSHLDRGGVPIVKIIGTMLQERYYILEQLGELGVVTTYLAVDRQLPGSLQLKCAIHRYQITAATDSDGWNRAALSAQILYELSQKVDLLPSVYAYFAEGDAFYLVREFVLGCPLSRELLPDRPWNVSRVVMLLADLLEVIHELDSSESIPDPICLSQILRRTLDRQLILVNFPIATGFPRSPTIDDLSPTQHNLRMVGEIAIAATMGLAGSQLPLSDRLRLDDWSNFAPTLEQPELVTIINRLISPTAEAQYHSTAVARQAVAGVMSKLLIHNHAPTDTEAEIAKHLRVLIERGNGFYEMGDCVNAIATYDRAIALDSNCVEAYCGRGNARRFLGEYAASWDDFERAISLDPRHGVAYVGRGLAICLQRSDDPQAIVDFERGKILLAQPQTAIEYVMRGTAHAQLRDNMSAIADYTHAIGINPRLVLAYNNRGNLRQHVQDWDGALGDFSKVLEINPKSAIAHNNRAIVYAYLSRHDESIADYSRAIELQPDFTSAYNNRGNAYSNLGKYPEATADYTRSIELDPNFAVSYSNRGNVQRIEGNLPAALSDYNLAISLDPNLTIAYYNRGICHRQAGNHRLAIADYTQTIALDRQYFYAYYHRANALQYLGESHGAIVDYTQTIRFDPDNVHAYYNRGVTRIEINDLIGAMQDFDRAIHLQSDLALAYYQRGWLYAKTDRHQLAVGEYQLAIALNPEHLEAYYQYGLSCLSLADRIGAIANFSQIIAIDPNYAPAYYQRAKIHTQQSDLPSAIDDYNRAARLYLDRGDSNTYQQILTLIDQPS